MDWGPLETQTWFLKTFHVKMGKYMAVGLRSFRTYRTQTNLVEDL
jgi:hypothetical protein